MLDKERLTFQVRQTLGAVSSTLEANKNNHSDSEPEEFLLIKGNKNARGELIYHVPGGAFYERTNPVELFRTEEEALQKGYRKSSR